MQTPALDNTAYVLSKKTFMAGAQCVRRLWWELHEPGAAELALGAAERYRMEEGSRVGVLARSYFTGGQLIERGGRSLDAILGDTRRAIGDDTVHAIYEGAAIADSTLVFPDVLERVDGGFTLVEVKSATSVTDAHIPDIAIQAHVLRKAGIPIVRCELMHLDRTCAHPNLENLFAREDVTERVESRLASIAAEIESMLSAAQAQSAPPIDPGDHCSEPSDCPFKPRCWLPIPDHHVSRLYRIGRKRAAEYVESGWSLINELPDDVRLSAIAARQRRSVRSGEIVVERDSLIAVLQSLPHPVAHIDFETVQPAIPVWPGCHPYDNVPVQLSCHVVGLDGDVRHYEWLFDGTGDPRQPIANAILEACAGASTVTAYFASFEQKCIQLVADACPDCAAELRDIAARIVDLLPIVRENVYHPEFGGSFSLKKVLPALVPSLGYGDLEIAEGQTASAELARMIFNGPSLSDVERATLRQSLLAYCRRDTEAMVALVDRLMRLASGAEQA